MHCACVGAGAHAHAPVHVLTRASACITYVQSRARMGMQCVPQLRGRLRMHHACVGASMPMRNGGRVGMGSRSGAGIGTGASAEYRRSMPPPPNARAHTHTHTHTHFTLTSSHWLFGRNTFQIFCHQITTIAKGTINQAWTWMNSTPRLPGRTVGRVAQHQALPPRQAQDRVIRSSNLLGLLTFQWIKLFNSVPPGLPVQGTFRRRCLGLLLRGQFSVDRQLEEVPKSGATTGTFFMASPDCRAVHPRKIFNISVTRS
eukprot:355384-Chlamydomonas_euryale.AAC.4